MAQFILMNHSTQDIETVFKDFQQTQEIRGLAQDTINSYMATYKLFTSYYSEENLCTSLNIKVINGFILFAKEKRHFKRHIYKFTS
ncbi:MAG: hypothetical protein FWD82_03460 [Defluviitaleaceae bacterium]|nr:hypothetical protein [Defluviitaleaceae bacterium]